MAPKSSDMNESLIGSDQDTSPSHKAASPPKTSPPSRGGDSNATRDSPSKSPPPPLQSSTPRPSPPPPPKASPSPPPPKALPPPPPHPSPPPRSSSNDDSPAPSPSKQPPASQSPPSSKKSPPAPAPAQPTAPPPSDDSSASGTGVPDKSPPPPPPLAPPPPLPSSLASTPNNSSPPNAFSSPPPTVFSPPPKSKSNRPPPPHSPAISTGSRGKSNRSTNSSSNSSSGRGGDNTAKYVGAALAGVLIIALVVVVLVLLLRRRRKRGEVYAAPPFMPPNNLPMKPVADGHYYLQQHGTGNASQDGIYRNGSQNQLGTPDTGPKSAQIVFSYENIVEITNGFSRQNILGEGGFGCVYKAWLPDGRVAAVKKLKAGSGQGEREFKAEVEIISRVHHRHLVSLVGYCIEEEQRILIYEFVPNKTLDHHLRGSEMPVLDWAKRQKIAIGAAKGLAYLHEDCSPKIIHRDIKSANILLDDAFEAQVADFGLAKLSDDAYTHVSTRVMGTFGYMAPEYATSGKLTDRSDVFSFGVVLLELVTGRKPVDQTQPVGDESLVEWARPLLIHAVETGDFGALVDPRLGRRFVESEMFRMIEAAAACIRHLAPKRPRMVQVVRALDSGDELFDLSNGVKYGQSTVYDSGQYNEDIMKFRRMNIGSSDNSDMYSGESSFSREMSGLQQSWVPGSSSGESETRALNGHSISTEHKNTRERR